MAVRTVKVFLSHSKQDKWLASQIARRITDCGATTFLDETDIPSGANFKEIINREISECQELVALSLPGRYRGSGYGLKSALPGDRANELLVSYMGLVLASSRK